MSHFRPFLLLLLLLSAPVKAQLWEYIVTSEHGNRYMIDPLSIKRQGNEVSYTQLTNYAKNFLPEPRKIRSIVQYKSNDCEHHKFAITHLIGYEQEDAKGSIVVVEMETKKKWLEVIPVRLLTSSTKRYATTSIDMFRFKHCSNYYYSGCPNKPETIHNNKEMCLKCFAQLIYENLEYGIKYGKSKDTYLLLYYRSSMRPSQRAFKIKR